MEWAMVPAYTVSYCLFNYNMSALREWIVSFTYACLMPSSGSGPHQGHNSSSWNELLATLNPPSLPWGISTWCHSVVGSKIQGFCRGGPGTEVGAMDSVLGSPREDRSFPKICRLGRNFLSENSGSQILVHRWVLVISEMKVKMDNVVIF